VSWARIDDKMAFGAKTIAAGNEAVGVWLRMLAWSCDQRTNGLVTRSVALTIAGKEKALERLVEVRMLDVDGDDFRIHDFLDWQPSADEIAAKRQARAEAGKRGGVAKALANARRLPSKQLANDIANSQQTEVEILAKVCPDPDPDPKRSSISLRDLAGQVLEALNASRKRVLPGARALRSIPSNTEQIMARLKEGSTVEECLHVIAVTEAEVRKKPDESGQWFDAVTPFRRENFGRKLGRSAPKAAMGSAANDLIAQIEARELAEAKARGLT
jgi:hypothetical protein